MSNTPHPRHPAPIDPTSPRAPAGWVWMAALFIVIMAAYGLYRGVTGVQAAQSALLGAPRPGTITPVDATSAAPLAHDDQWSTLSGPKVLPPPPPKVVKPAAPDDAEDDSGAPDQPDAADAAAPETLAPTLGPAPAPAQPSPDASPQAERPDVN